MEFEFLEDSDLGILGNCDGDRFRGNKDGIVDRGDDDGDDDDEKENDEGSNENSKSFWENQHQALQQTLFRTNSIELRIRNATKDALKDIQRESTVCGCGKSSMAEDCRNCLTREKSRKSEVRVIIELNFRAEFEIARASEDYNRLVQRLPDVFVGKVERLSNVIKILCSAAKKCMKEKKMHMGPWRKQGYMQAKWLKSCERNTSNQPLPVGCSGSRLTKPKASMLTEDLLDVHCTALEVV
ncbi:hypothetical protein F3Y22_tig00109924pilonHSYRG00086 [Hibiscus syriacus]|uniref:Uncharacterized protein n=1 Tax=Hibiscus syriacus TaxID=106335 RepID=A0A6A3BVL0_HIBSY|nr:hypothetical protein F3Y22_tig00109924pilonHSYRG00086 [Hibiscus syriacus]